MKTYSATLLQAHARRMRVQRTAIARPSAAMQRHLAPFAPETLVVTALGDAGSIESYESMGFKARSMQDNFLRGGDPNKVVVVVHVASAGLVDRIDHPAVVASCFGRRTSSGGGAEVWHVGVNKRHALNNSDSGRRWGHYGLRKDTSGAKTRWTSEGRKLTMKNHVKFVMGSANPYAVQALWGFCTVSEAKDVWQNPELPCAQLFHPNYDHSTHPAVQLVYTSLDFVKTPLGNFARYGDASKPLAACLQQFFSRMRVGADAS